MAVRVLGVRGLGCLGRAGGSAALGQTLRATDSPGPVQVGAHLTRPLVGGLCGAGGPDPGPGTGVRADEKATTSAATTSTAVITAVLKTQAIRTHATIFNLWVTYSGV